MRSRVSKRVSKRFSKRVSKRVSKRGSKTSKQIGGAKKSKDILLEKWRKINMAEQNEKIMAAEKKLNKKEKLTELDQYALGHKRTITSNEAAKDNRNLQIW